MCMYYENPMKHVNIRRGREAQILSVIVTLGFDSWSSRDEVDSCGSGEGQLRGPREDGDDDDDDNNNNNNNNNR